MQGVADSGKVETVYNWRIADYHRYFVSATRKGAFIWVHNAGGQYNGNGQNASRTPKNPKRPGQPGDPDHVADVAKNNNQPTGELRPKPVGGRKPDGVGELGQVVTIRGQTIDPGPNGRVIVESERFRKGRPVSLGREQIRDIRAADLNATIVVTDPKNPNAPPLIYPPGTQPPRRGWLPKGTGPIEAYP